MKKIVLAIDSFKGCLSSTQVEAACADSIRKIYPQCQIVSVPIADGGEGMLDALSGLGGTMSGLRVHGPLGKAVDAHYLISVDRKTAYIEMALASGLTLVPVEQRDPMLATTYGTGQLMRHALDHGCRHLVIGLGGSATNDGGLGMLAALGYRFFNQEGNLLYGCGKDLRHVMYVDDSHIHPALKEIQCTAACDVRNPFCGPEGAAYTFAPQKGADRVMVETLDEGLKNWARVMTRITGRDITALPGAGAAGGLGGALAAFLRAGIRPGIDLLLEANRFADRIMDADLIITGEGRADIQTLMGKTPLGVLRLARQAGIPVFLIAGQVENREELLAAGFSQVYAITPQGMPFVQAMRKEIAETNICRAMKELLSPESLNF